MYVSRWNILIISLICFRIYFIFSFDSTLFIEVPLLLLFSLSLSCSLSLHLFAAIIYYVGREQFPLEGKEISGRQTRLIADYIRKLNNTYSLLPQIAFAAPQQQRLPDRYRNAILEQIKPRNCCNSLTIVAW